MQGRERTVTQHVFFLFLFFFRCYDPTNIIALSRNKNKTSVARGIAVHRRFFSVTEHTRQDRGWLDLGPSAVFRVGGLYNCFDMPLSNTSAPWPAARRWQRGYNPSVEPSLSHRALIQRGLAPRTASPPPWLFSPISFGRGVWRDDIDPKPEGMDVLKNRSTEGSWNTL